MFFKSIGTTGTYYDHVKPSEFIANVGTHSTLINPTRTLGLAASSSAGPPDRSALVATPTPSPTGSPADRSTPDGSKVIIDLGNPTLTLLSSSNHQINKDIFVLRQSPIKNPEFSGH